MFWNNEFLDPSPSHIDVLLQNQKVRLIDILFEDDIMQELKTSNVSLVNFLSRSDVIAELVDNIAKLTEKDCCDKSLYSRIHSAYVSCEILTSGSTEIFNALINHPQSLPKIISCLTKQYMEEEEPKEKEKEKENGREEIEKKEEKEEKVEEEPQEIPFDWDNFPPTEGPLKRDFDNQELDHKKPSYQELQISELDQQLNAQSAQIERQTRLGLEEADKEDKQPQHGDRQPQHQVEEKQQDQVKEEEQQTEEEKQPDSVDGKTEEEQELKEQEEKKGDADEEKKENEKKQEPPLITNNVKREPLKPPVLLDSTKVVPQKATLISKLISTLHSSSPERLSCVITQNFGDFTKLLDLLVQNIDISGACEILNTLVKKTTPPEYRHFFCEILNKLKFVNSLIEVMTLSDAEDKQRNACLLLCDIIVIGRQEVTDQTNSGPMSQDMLAELLESSQAVHVILDQMFSDNMKNTTAIVCGMKVLQKLLEQKSAGDGDLLVKTIQQTQEEIEKHLIKFHELLLNPPKQQPIKTTFGIIQKPLGYMRLEVVNLIRALISTNSPNIIKKLVDLRTMKVIIDLFIEYSWNNLLHTQVEQALCLIINNYRRDEELNYHIDVQQHSHINNHHSDIQLAGALDNKMTEGDTVKLEEQDNQTNELTLEQQQSRLEQSVTEIPSRALLSQLLNECDLIGRLLIPGSVTISGEQANFGHIIQMINSIAINRDLDTIRDHLNEMKDKRPELYDRWTTFVNVDVASFKEISLYYDAQSANNNVNHRYNQQFPNSQHLTPSNSPQYNDVGSVNDDQFWAFVEENVIPKINVDVFPRLRRSNNHQTMYKKSSQQ